MEEDKHFNSILHLVPPNATSREPPLKIITEDDQQSVTLPSCNQRPSATFQFDGLSSLRDATPKAIYKESVMDLVASVLKGYNGTFVSLGQECTDHFSFVLASSQGVLLEAAKHILQCIKKLKRTGMSANLVVPCSYVLIVNEKIYDLLLGFNEEEMVSSPSQIQPSNITISDSKVKGAKIVEAKSLKDVVKMLQHGSKAKDGILLSFPDCGAYHCTFTIGIEYAKFGSMFAPVSGTLTTAVVILPDNIDLKCLEESSATLDTESIVALSSVIHQLVNCSSQVPNLPVPYGNSLLTSLLQAAFGGNSKTLLMTHVPIAIPFESHCRVRNILELGSRARNIQNRPDKMELAEKALMDAYRRELQRMYGGGGTKSGKGEDMGTDSQEGNQEEEVLVAQALASAVKDEFEDKGSDESEDEESQDFEGTSGYFSKSKKISLKPKKCQSKMSHMEQQEIPDEGQNQAPEDITIESLVALIQDPDNGVPRALESELVNVQIHRGKGSVFSGAAIVQWLLANVVGVESEEAAEQLGQILLDKGAIFHSEGSSLFFNSKILFYYARHSRFTGKILSVEEIKALLAPPLRGEKAEPTMQVTTIESNEQGTGDEASNKTDKLQSKNDEHVKSFPDNNESATGTQDNIHDLTSIGVHGIPSHHDDPQNNIHDLTSIGVHGRPTHATISSASSIPSSKIVIPSDVADSKDSGLQQTDPVNDSENTAIEDTTSSSPALAQQPEKLDEPNVQDIQGPDLITLEKSTDYPHPLHYASAIGKDSGVIGQLVNWYGVDCCDEQKRTPLMFAALGNKASVCRVLINCGATLDRRDQSGLTAAHIACYHGSKDALSVLLRKGANVTINDRMSHTVYHWSVVPEDPHCLKMLMKHAKKSPSFEDQIDKHGLSPLHWAIHYNHPEHLKLLANKSQSLLRLDSKGRTLMTYAIGKEAFQCVEILLSSEFSCSLARAPDKNGLTPLHHASANKSPIYIASILNFFNSLKEANINEVLNAKDAYGRTPLHYATIYQRLQNLQLLLQFGADTSLQDNDYKGPLEVAECFGEVSMDITRLIQDGPESEVDLKTVIDSNQPQSLTNRNKSSFCILI